MSIFHRRLSGVGGLLGARIREGREKVAKAAEGFDRPRGLDGFPTMSTRKSPPTGTGQEKEDPIEERTEGHAEDETTTAAPGDAAPAGGDSLDPGASPTPQPGKSLAAPEDATERPETERHGPKPGEESRATNHATKSIFEDATAGGLITRKAAEGLASRFEGEAHPFTACMAALADQYPDEEQRAQVCGAAKAVMRERGTAPEQGKKAEPPFPKAIPTASQKTGTSVAKALELAKQRASRS